MPYFSNSTTQIMGILNLTKDSFSDGEKYIKLEQAIKQAEYLIKRGADIIDLGAESTKPGAKRVSEETELRQIIPLVQYLQNKKISISIDTMRSKVANAAIEAGANIINDVSGGVADPEMKNVLAKNKNIKIILMHWDNPPHESEQNTGILLKTSKINNKKVDIITKIKTDLQLQSEKFIKAGVPKENIILDPGIGFSKTFEQNWEILNKIDSLQDLGYKLLIGASRKKFLTDITHDSDNPNWENRDLVTATISKFMSLKNVWAVRVHEIK